MPRSAGSRRGAQAQVGSTRRARRPDRAGIEPPSQNAANAVGGIEGDGRRRDRRIAGFQRREQHGRLVAEDETRRAERLQTVEPRRRSPKPDQRSPSHGRGERCLHPAQRADDRVLGRGRRQALGVALGMRDGAPHPSQQRHPIVRGEHDHIAPLGLEIEELPFGNASAQNAMGLSHGARQRSLARSKPAHPRVQTGLWHLPSVDFVLGR